MADPAQPRISGGRLVHLEEHGQLVLADPRHAWRRRRDPGQGRQGGGVTAHEHADVDTVPGPGIQVVQHSGLVGIEGEPDLGGSRAGLPRALPGGDHEFAVGRDHEIERGPGMQQLLASERDRVREGHEESGVVDGRDERGGVVGEQRRQRRVEGRRPERRVYGGRLVRHDRASAFVASGAGSPSR